MHNIDNRYFVLRVTSLVLAISLGISCTNTVDQFDDTPKPDPTAAAELTAPTGPTAICPAGGEYCLGFPNGQSAAVERGAIWFTEKLKFNLSSSSLVGDLATFEFSDLHFEGRIGKPGQLSWRPNAPNFRSFSVTDVTLLKSGASFSYRPATYTTVTGNWTQTFWDTRTFDLFQFDSILLWRSASGDLVAGFIGTHDGSFGVKLNEVYPDHPGWYVGHSWGHIRQTRASGQKVACGPERNVDGCDFPGYGMSRNTTASTAPN